MEIPKLDHGWLRQFNTEVELLEGRTTRPLFWAPQRVSVCLSCDVVAASDRTQCNWFQASTPVSACIWSTLFWAQALAISQQWWTSDAQTGNPSRGTPLISSLAPNQKQWIGFIDRQESQDVNWKMWFSSQVVLLNALLKKNPDEHMNHTSDIRQGIFESDFWFRRNCDLTSAA